MEKTLLELVTENNSKSMNLSCRLDRIVYNMLVSEAQKKGISINSLVNSIAKNYVSWDRHANNIGFVGLTKKAINDIFDELSEKKIKTIAEKVGTSVPRDLLMMLFNKITFDSIIIVLELWNERFGKVQHDYANSKHSFTIYHEINENFSKYILYLHKAMASDLNFYLNEIHLGPNSVSFTVQEKPI